MDISKFHFADKSDQQVLLTVTPNTLLIDAIQQMSQAQSSFVLIVEQQRLIGIFTQRDVLRAMSNIKLIDTDKNNNTFEKIGITEFITQPVITLSERDAEDLPTVLERFHQHRIRHLPVIDSQGQVLRVITPWEVIDNIRHIHQLDDGNTTALEPEIKQPQEMEQLLGAREIQLNEILDRAIATSIVSFRVFPNRDWVYDYQSIGCETLFGYTSEEITSDKNFWMSRVHPQDVETVILPLFEDICAERTTSVEFRFYHKDGSERWLSATYTSDYDATANCWIVTGSTHDITERQAALRDRQLIEAELQERNHFIEQIVNYSPYLKEQENWWLTSLTPLRDENSRIYRIVGNSVNITERKRTEQMLELQAVITRNMAEGICLISATDGVFVYTNPKFEQMFGYDSGELIGQHVSIINYTDDKTSSKTVYERLATIVMQNGAATYEVHNLKKDGTPFWCSASASVFDHPEYGTVFVGVQQDITEQKQAQEKIKTALKEKEVLLQEIHHRVKNNLGIVSSLLQMQFRRTQDPQVKSILRDSQNRIASIALVHEKLYRYPEFVDINFSQYITELTTDLFETYNVNYSQIQLKIKIDYASLDMKIAIPCGLILNELVSNALKYAFPNNIQGEIKVIFYSENDQNLSLIIEDNGVGLPVDFDTQKFTTLGLTLVQGLVKQLQGTIEINSHPGTKFKITFTKGKE